MTVKKERLIRLYKIICRELFTLDSSLNYSEIIKLIIQLADAVKNYEGDDWHYIGEFDRVCLSDFIVGSYWHFIEWHSGQYSNSYIALSALGQIYNPNCCNGCEPDSGEEDVYTALENIAYNWIRV